MNEGTLQAGSPSNYNSQLGDTCQAEQQSIPRCSTGIDAYAVNREIPVPPNGQVNKIRQINIEEVNRGFIVRVGCHTFAISTRAELTTKLTEYINEPEKTEQKWFKNELF